MPLIAETIAKFRTVSKDAVGSSIPTWQSGVAQLPNTSYETYARDGYQKNELVFACVDALATSAAEPRMIAVRRDQHGEEQHVPDHPLEALINKPNPFMTRFDLIATIIMHMALAGNCYVEKVRSSAGKVVELWVLRPDRVRIVPDKQRFVGGYEYRIGGMATVVDAADVIHFRHLAPLDDFYGMPPLMAASGRTDIDNYMRDFVKGFFQNAGVPAGMLNVSRAMTPQDKDLVRRKFQGDFSGPQGWHNLMIVDGQDATYTPMGLPLGARGMAAPELDEISESRIAMVFGVPLILIGSRLGMQRSTFANAREAKETFWDNTLSPLYTRIEHTFNQGFQPESADNTRLKFDMADVRALRQDEDALAARVRANIAGTVMSIEEGRLELGMDPDIDPTHTFLLPMAVSPVRGAEIENPPATPAPVPAQLPAPKANNEPPPNPEPAKKRRKVVV